MKNLITAARVFFFLSLLTGIFYPLFVTAIGSAFFPKQAGGSLIWREDGSLVGSALLAQEFKSSKYFWARPSAGPYSTLPSGGSNLGPSSKALQQQWEERRKIGLSGPMLSASGSGLDPHISPDSAMAQSERVAEARGLDIAHVQGLVIKALVERQMGIFGEPTVNVLELNLLLDREIPKNL